MGATSNYGWGLPVQASAFAKDLDRVLYVVHGSMITIFLVWAFIFAYLLIKYRARPGRAAEHSAGRRWWLYLPLALVFSEEIFIIARHAIPAWAGAKIDRPRSEDSNNMRVVAEQFAWNVQYPGKDGRFGRIAPRFIDSSNVLGLDPDDPDGKDDVVTLNVLHVPLGKPTLLELSSKDVIHSFFIPEFRVKQDAVPGMRVPVWFTPTLAGKYELVCAQLCGNAHSTMRADVIAEPPEEFAAWLKSQAPAGKG